MDNFNSGYTPQPLPTEPKKNNIPLIIAIVAVVLCCCCLIVVFLGYYLWINGDQMFGTGAMLNNLISL